MADEDVRTDAPAEAAETTEQKTEAQPEKKTARGQLTLKISEKGALSIYGLGRFPVTLYKEQWTRLLAISDQIRKFIEENNEKLKTKES